MQAACSIMIRFPRYCLISKYPRNILHDIWLNFKAAITNQDLHNLWGFRPFQSTLPHHAKSDSNNKWTVKLKLKLTFETPIDLPTWITPKKGRQLDPRIPSMGPRKTLIFFLWIKSDQLWLSVYHPASVLCGFDATILRQTDNVQ